MSEEWFNTKNKTEKIVEAIYNVNILFLCSQKN